MQTSGQKSQTKRNMKNISQATPSQQINGKNSESKSHCHVKFFKNLFYVVYFNLYVTLFIDKIYTHNISGAEKLDTEYFLKFPFLFESTILPVDNGK